jgi:S-DNA-T family DNA segregation ATPase FtsK/SpoIIIE
MYNVLMDNVLYAILGSVITGSIFAYVTIYKVKKISTDTIKTVREEIVEQPIQVIPDSSDDDFFLREGIEIARSRGSITTSVMQRKFRIGYGRAARLIDKMVDSKIVEEQPTKIGETYQHKYIAGSADKATLKFAIGKNESGELIYGDFREIGHFLSSGCTGSGHASFDEGAFVTNLIQNYSPTELKFVMIDPKQVQLLPYEEIPHLLMPVTYTPEKSKEAVQYLLDEVESRFDLLSKAHVKNIDEHNLHSAERLPFIILLIPEIADLMMIDKDFYLQAFLQFAMKSRAVGVHIYLGTQRPSEDVLPGELVAMITGKLIFKTASKKDSDYLLYEQARADRLDKQGELYYMGQDLKPMKLQAEYVSDEQIVKIVDEVKAKAK